MQRKISRPRSHNFPLELQVGYRMRDALWVRLHCGFFMKNVKTWVNGKCKTWSMDCSDTRVGERKFAVPTLRRSQTVTLRILWQSRWCSSIDTIMFPVAKVDPFVLQGCYAAYLGGLFPTIGDSLSVLSSKDRAVLALTLENVTNRLSVDAVLLCWYAGTYQRNTTCYRRMKCCGPCVVTCGSCPSCAC